MVKIFFLFLFSITLGGFIFFFRETLVNEIDCNRSILKKINDEINSFESREKGLESVFKARRKYDSQSLQALPFSGYTVMYEIKDKQRSELNFDYIEKNIIQPLKDIGLGQVTAFVDSSHYHITTFDLIHEKMKALFIQSGFNFSESVDNVRNLARTYLNNLNPIKLNAKVKGVRTFGGKLLVLELQLEPESREFMKKLRTDFNDFLVEHAPEYALVNGDNWSGHFSPHITLGYNVNPVPEEKYDAYLEIIGSANGLFIGKTIQFDMGHLYSFTSMDRFTKLF